jgi:hypothetical protein
MKKNGYQRPTGLRADPHAEEHLGRLRDLGAVGVLGFAHDLAHVAAGRPVVRRDDGRHHRHTFNYKRDYYIPAEEVTRTEEAHTKLLEAMSEINAERRRERRHQLALLRARASSGKRHAAGLLDLPDERLPHLRQPVRDLCRPGPQLRRRPVGRRAVRPAAGGAQHRLPAGVVDHLRLRHAGGAEGQEPEGHLVWLASPACSAPASWAWSCTSSRT